MARVMLIGDSIRMSYEPRVKEALGAEGHEVWGAPGNSQFALFTLASLGGWLGLFPDPDVVHWNNGLHDIGHNPNRAPMQMPLDVYAGNLRFIGRMLLTTGARVLFASSTPVHPDRPFREDQWSWRNEEIDAYNEAARGVMAELGIQINELHAVVAADVDRLLSEDQLHLSEDGQAACAAAVCQSVKEQLSA
jgi:isoamyl acetate esterase